MASAGIHPHRLERVNAGSTPPLTHATNAQSRSVQVALKESSTHPQAEVAPFAAPPFPPGGSIRAASAAHGSAPEVPLGAAVSRRAAARLSHAIGLPPGRDVLSPQPVLVRARAVADAAKSTEQPRAVYPLEQRRPSELRRPAGPQPTIQVTIGRIEVRAEQPPSLPPAKDRSNLKPMSLDEYLRRRTGRRRE